MANQKIKIMDLGAGTVVDTDWIPYVDVSDTTQSAEWTTKRALKTDLIWATWNWISSIVLTWTVWLVDTYRITYTDLTTFDYTVTNWLDGTNWTNWTNGTNWNWIISITLISTVWLVKTYRILFTDTTTFDYTVTDWINWTWLVNSVVAWTNITVDNTDPTAPIIASPLQTITLTGDVTWWGTWTFAATLANSWADAWTYTNANVTVDSKWRVTTIVSWASWSGWIVSTTNEVPTWLVNWSNTVYTISNWATWNEIVVTLNWLKQLETTDYSLSWTTLTFVVAPFTGAILEVYYVNSTSSAWYQTNTKSGNYTLVNTDYVILADTTSSDITLTLPTAVWQSWRTFVLKKTSVNNDLIVDWDWTETIDWELTAQVSTWSKWAITVHSDWTNWYII